MHPHPDALTRIGRRGAARDAYTALVKIADERGVAVIAGGVRGWAELFGCSPSYPKQALATLVEEEIAAVDFLGEGLAEVTILLGLRSASDRPATAVAATDDSTESFTASQCGERSITDRTPPTPPHVVHDSSNQQQQHDRARAEDSVPDRAVRAARWAESAPTNFPRVEPAVIARIAADPWFDEETSARALRGRPSATLAEFERELKWAAERPTTRNAIGLLLVVWGRSEAIAPPSSRSSRPPEPPTADRRRAEGFDPAGARAFVERQSLPANAPPVKAPTPPGPAPCPDRGLAQIWQAALGTLREQLTRQEFDAWLLHADLVALADGIATVVVLSPLQAEGLSHRYAQQLRRALGDVLGYPVQVRVVVRGGL